METQQQELNCEDEGNPVGENHQATREVDANEEVRSAHLENSSLDSSQGKGARARRVPRWMTDYDTRA